MRVVFFSGPPQSGKDTCGRILGQLLAEEGVRVVVTPLASTLKAMTHAHHAALRGETSYPQWDAFEETKEESEPFFDGKTPRQAYIDYHEQVIVPALGRSFLADHKVRIFREQARGRFDVAIVTDPGGNDQVAPFVEAFGEAIVVRLTRPGTTWRDNRTPIQGLSGCRILDYANDGSEADIAHWLKVHVFDSLIVQR